MSRLDELQSRIMLTRPNPRDTQLRIEETNMGSWLISDASGALATVYDANDILAIVALQFKTTEGARRALNSVPDYPPQADGPIDHRPNPGRVTREDVPPPPVMSPEAQAAAQRLRDRALNRRHAVPDDLQAPKTYEADGLDNPGDPQVLYGTEPDPELGQ